jgi:hypothetical protein
VGTSMPAGTLVRGVDRSGPICAGKADVSKALVVTPTWQVK